jgi:hypothetical protein
MDWSLSLRQLDWFVAELNLMTDALGLAWLGVAT